MKMDSGSKQDEDENKEYFGSLTLNVYQAAILNKRLPLGFRIDNEDAVIRNAE